MNQLLPVSHRTNQQSSQQRIYSIQSIQAQNQNNNIGKSTPNQRFQQRENPEYLGQSQFIHINNQINLIETDINQNNQQIRMLNNKISKSDYEHAYLNKLYLKDRVLQQKQKQMQQTLLNHQFMKQQLKHKKTKQIQVRHELGNQYQSIVFQKKRRNQQEKCRQLEQEAAMIDFTQKALSYEQQRKKQYMDQQKRQVQQQLKIREQKRIQQKNQRQRQKAEFNNRVQVRNKLQTQKDQVYKQYYNHFMDQQDKLQNIYKNKAGQIQIQKQKQRLEIQKKQIEGFQQRLAYENQEKLRKITYQKEALKNYLKSQMQQNQRRKYRQKSQELNYQNQVRQYQINQGDYEIMERMKRKDQQKRYDEELATQMKFKNTYQNLSQDNSMREPYIRQNHNPITNPIDFKIGITNPYVIKEYENTKQKYTGDNHLKLRNLASIGNNSLVHH